MDRSKSNEVRTFDFEVKLVNGNSFQFNCNAHNLPQAWVMLENETKGKYVVSKTYLGGLK